MSVRSELAIQKRVSENSKVNMKPSLKLDDTAKSPFNLGHHRYPKDKFEDRSMKTEGFKYHLESRGILENNLLISLKIDANGIICFFFYL